MVRQLRGLLACALLGVGALPLQAQATDAGRIAVVSGGASIIREGQTLPAQQNVVLHAGDSLNTSIDGQVQWRMSDEALFLLKPKSSFTIKEYVDQGGGAGKSIYVLQQGQFLMLSGLIKAPENHRVETPAARIEVQGTKYLSAACKRSCKQRDGKLIADGTYIGVREGVVVMSNQGGRLSVKAGQYAFAANVNTAPVLLDAAPDMFLELGAELEFEFEFDVDPGSIIERPASPS